MIKERIFTVDRPEFELHGVIVEPETIIPDRPFVVIPNSGLVHHVGTCRSSVQFTRALAKAGFLALRVDLCQLGDSSARLDNESMTDDERTIQELQAILDQVICDYKLEQDAKVVMYGLCSGSQNSFKLAVNDDRVVGIMGIDHFGFQNWSYYCVHYCKQIFRLSPWLNRFKKLIGKAMPMVSGEAVDLGDGGFEWTYPPKEEVEAGYRSLISRQVRMSFVYTGDWSGEYNHKSQFFKMHSSVDFKGLVSVQYKPEMSHILSEPESQQAMSDQLVAFASSFVKP